MQDLTLKKGRRKCNRCESQFCSYGFKGTNADQRKLMFVAHMLDSRIFEEDLLGEKGHYRAFLESESGKAIARLLAHPMLNLTIEDIYFTNVFKGFFEGRMPGKEEYRACLANLDRQIEDFQPLSILTMGRFAYSSMFPNENGFENDRGKVILYRNVPTLVTYHPSTILKMPIQHRMRMIDFIKSSLR